MKTDACLTNKYCIVLLRRFAAVFFACLFLYSTAFAAPALINYQGKLTDDSGNPLPTGQYKLEFNIYNAASGGTKLWGPQIFDGDTGTGHGQKVMIVNGEFNVILGEKDTANRSITNACNHDDAYLEIKVNDGYPIEPRQRILSAPYSIMAGTATELAYPYSGDIRATGSVEAFSGAVKMYSTIRFHSGLYDYYNGIDCWSQAKLYTMLLGSPILDVSYGVLELYSSAWADPVFKLDSKWKTLVIHNYNYDPSNMIELNGENGSLLARGTKSFVMEYPGRPGKQIIYSSIEGPEAAAYSRGTVELVSGEAWVEFEDHFKVVINPETMTVQVTPLSAESKGLAVIEKGPDGFRIKELFGGVGNYKVDYFVQAVRKGYEDYQPVRNK